MDPSYRGPASETMGGVDAGTVTAGRGAVSGACMIGSTQRIGPAWATP